MALLIWNQDEYSVGVPSIDEQHLVLFQLINKIHDAVLDEADREAAGAALARLVKYTQEHFSREEQAMVSTRYPGLAQHLLRHQELMRQVNEFHARFLRGEVALNEELLDFLCDWLVSHIQNVDRDCGAWLQEKGVA